MEVSVVHKSEYKPKTVSYFNAIAVGALSGYALKYLCPITKQEKEGDYKPSLQELRKQTREAKLAEVKAIKNAKEKAFGTDAFVKLAGKKTFAEMKTEFNSLPKPEQKAVLALLNQVNAKAREITKASREFAQNLSSAWLKHIRPTGPFVGAGVGVALIGALIYNVIQRTSAKQSA